MAFHLYRTIFDEFLNFHPKTPQKYEFLKSRRRHKEKKNRKICRRQFFSLLVSRQTLGKKFGGQDYFFTVFMFRSVFYYISTPLFSSQNLPYYRSRHYEALQWQATIYLTSHNVYLLSLTRIRTQTAVIVTQRLPIVGNDMQLTIFCVTQRFPIIAHVNMHANLFSRHTTSPYCRHRSFISHLLGLRCLS